MAFSPNGDASVIVANSEANDFVINAKGGIYHLNTGSKWIKYYDGKNSRVVFKGDELTSPRGLALSPDQGMLVVTDQRSRFSWSLQIAADGSLINGEPFYRLEMPESGTMTGAQSSMLDSIGQVYFGTEIGIQMCEANGRVAVILNKPELGALGSIAFAGKDSNWLYAAQGGKLYRRPTKVAGVPVWSPTKPPQPPL